MIKYIYHLLSQKCTNCGKFVADNELLQKTVDTINGIPCEIIYRCPFCNEVFDYWAYGSYEKDAELAQFEQCNPIQFKIAKIYKKLEDLVYFNIICRKAWVLSKNNKWQYYKLILWINCFGKFFKFGIPIFVKHSNLTPKQQKALQVFSDILKALNKE